MHKTT